MRNLTTIGRIFFGTALAASGLQQLIIRDFVRLVPKLPAWVPWPSVWPGAIGVVLIVAGGAILLDRQRPWAASVVGALLLFLFLVLRVPEIVSNPLVGFMWTNPSKILALWGGTLFLTGALPGENNPGLRWTERLICLGPILFGVFLLICGIQHFIYARFVDSLVPAWIPPGPRFWTCFAGVALIVGGTGILIPRTTRWAAALAGLMIFLWVPLLHIPRALADVHNAGETSAIFEALALSGVAFLLAGTRAANRS
jgi:uncharacterized membrane protein